MLALLQIQTVLNDLNRAANPLLKNDTTPEWLDFYAQALRPFHVASGYGLFQTMTASRPKFNLEGNTDAEKLLKHNPFPEEPSRFLLMQLYNYEFTTPGEKAETGQWWKRSLLETYLRPAALKSAFSER